MTFSTGGASACFGAHCVFELLGTERQIYCKPFWYVKMKFLFGDVLVTVNAKGYDIESED